MVPVLDCQIYYNVILESPQVLRNGMLSVLEEVGFALGF